MLARRRHLPHTVLIAHTYQMPLIYPSCQSVCICESTCPVILCVCSQRAAVQTVQPSLAQHRDPWATTPNCSLGITAALSPLSPHPFFLIPLSFPKAAPNSRSLTRSLSQAHTLVTSCYVSSWWKKCVMPRLMISIITGGDNEVVKFSMMIVMFRFKDWGGPLRAHVPPSGMKSTAQLLLSASGTNHLTFKQYVELV